MSQLMSQNSKHLLISTSLATVLLWQCVDILYSLIQQQSIEQYNSLGIKQSIEVGVAMRGPFRSLDDKQLLQGELQGCRQFLNIRPQLSIVQWLVRVKEWRNDTGIDGHKYQRDNAHERPEPDEEVVASTLHDGNDCGGNGQAEGQRHQETLQLVLDEEGQRLLVESVFLFEAEDLIDRSGRLLANSVEEKCHHEHAAHVDLIVRVQVQLCRPLQGQRPEPGVQSDIDLQASDDDAEDKVLEDAKAFLVQAVDACLVEGLFRDFVLEG